MPSVLSESIREQTSPTRSPISNEIHLESPLEKVAEETDLQYFCRLQIEQLIQYLPDSCVRLVYQCPDLLQRQIFVQGTEFWSLLDIDAQIYLESETWWSAKIEPSLRQIFEGVQQRFYVYPLNRTKREYLLIGTCRPLSVKQCRFVETCAKLLTQHIAMAQKLNDQRDLVNQIKQKNHQVEHQLRNPIALIEIYTKILLSVIEEGQSHSYLELIQSSVEEIRRHLLNLTTSQESLKVEQCDLRRVLAESLQYLQPWLQEKEIAIAQSDLPAFAEVDAWKIRQVFENLLSNAIHFSPQAGTIGCSWQIFQHEILVEIWDEGSGLSATDLQYVFTPFYSRRPGGTGLGLSIAEKIIADHQGRLWVSNLPSRGAKFSFSLPMRQTQSEIKYLEKDCL